MAARLSRDDERRAWPGKGADALRGSFPGEVLAGTEIDEPRRIRVLHVHSGRDYGGLERLLLCLGAARAAAPDMEPVFALGYRHRLARELAASGARVEILGGASRSKPWLGLVALWRMRAILRRERFAAVVCHGSSALAIFGRVARAQGVPLFFWMHGDTKVRNKNLIEILAGRSAPAVAICNSAFTAASLPLLFSKPPPHFVIHCPVSLPAGSPPEDRALLRGKLRSELNTPNDAVVVILPSRIETWKGHEILLEALGLLRHRKEWVCWIVGGPFNEEQVQTLARLEAAAKTSGIEDRVRFAGQRENVPELLESADIFCQPNLTPEPFGVNVVEALHAGLPVVVSNTGGTLDIVDETCGRFAAPGDVPALARELERLILDPVLRRTLSRAAPARGRSISDPALILPALRDCITSLDGPGDSHKKTSAQSLEVAAANRLSRG